MMKLIVVAICSLAWIGAAIAPSQKATLSSKPIDANTPVSELLISLGDAPQKHYIKEIDPKKVAIGKDLVHTGNSVLADGTKSKRISEFFVCTDCHNVVPEADNALENNPDARLDYAMKNDIPYLTGSTFWGIVNRTGWFNGDHIKKYGDLVKPANHDLHGAIQLCSRECSSGRYLEDWELDAMMHYLTSLQLKVSDLKLSEQEMVRVQQNDGNAAAITLVKSHYLNAVPATFLEPKLLESRGLGGKGDAVKGKFLYEKSCLHCHKEGGVTKTVFGEGKGMKNTTWLLGYLSKNNGGSIYYICRKGTAPKKGTMQYMPIYSSEKLSDAQLEDLAAFIVDANKSK